VILPIYHFALTHLHTQSYLSVNQYLYSTLTHSVLRIYQSIFVLNTYTISLTYLSINICTQHLHNQSYPSVNQYLYSTLTHSVLPICQSIFVLNTYTISLTHTSTNTLTYLFTCYQPKSAMVSPKLSELTNSLANLKWGFKRRYHSPLIIEY
jgi:hypothetical protein